jgi:hypothetical protein
MKFTSKHWQKLHPGLKRSLLSALKGMIPVKAPGASLYNEEKFRDYATFPMPELLLFGLRDLADFPWTGHEEKVRWSIYFDFKGKPWMLQLRKMGFAVLYRKDSAPDFQEVIRRLKNVALISAKYLEWASQITIVDGNVTIQNHYDQLDRRYKFFRKLAQDSFDQAELVDSQLKDSKDGVAKINAKYRHIREGDYFSGSMIDAFFSRLEHLMVLVLPFESFKSFDPSQGALKRFVRSNWDEKLKVLVDVQSVRFKKIYDELKRIKDIHRNPIAHGGFKKGLGSFYFHLEGVAALPSTLLRPEGKQRPEVWPSAYRQICSVFDELDALFLAEKPLACQYVFSGLDVAFDQKSRLKYSLACRNEDSMTEFIDREQYFADQHANMDY